MRADEMARRRRPALGVAGLLILMLSAGAVTHVWVRMKKIEVAYDLGRVRLQNDELREQQRRLQIEIGMLEDPGRVVTIARAELGMGPPAPGAIRAVGAHATAPPAADPATAVAGMPAVVKEDR